MSFYFDPHVNFVQTSVATPPSDPLNGTTLTVLTGTGNNFPAIGASGGFNCVVCPPGVTPNQTTAEVVRVTNVNFDTFTIVRARENSIGQNILAGYNLYLAITSKVIQDIEVAINNIGQPTLNANGLQWFNSDTGQWYTKMCLGNPPQDVWVTGTTASIRYNYGTGLQWFNTDTGLWHTKICVGNPPQDSWDIGNTAPAINGNIPELSGNVRFYPFDSNVRFNRNTGLQWYNPDTNLWHTKLCVGNPPQDGWDVGTA